MMKTFKSHDVFHMLEAWVRVIKWGSFESKHNYRYLCFDSKETLLIVNKTQRGCCT